MTRRFLTAEAQARFAQDRIDAIRKIGDRAKESSAEFIVVAGDVFESNQVKPQTVLRALEALGSISVPVILLPANHDPLDSASVYRSKVFAEKKPDTVHVIETSEPVVVPGVDGVEIVGVPWVMKRPLIDSVAERTALLEPCPPGEVRVVLAHGAIDSLSPDPEALGTIGLEHAETAISDGRVQYFALGDRHSSTDLSETGSIWYSGSHVATGFRDEDPGNVLLVEISDDRSVNVKVLPVDQATAWRFVSARFDLTGLDDVKEVESFLDDQPDKARAIVRLALAGHLSIPAKAYLDKIFSDSKDEFASVRKWDRHTDLETLPDKIDGEGLNLSGYVRLAWDELEAMAANSGEPGKMATDALCLLYRLVRSHEADTASMRESPP
jgi:DNA repair exonuclease SbcCD nuclease subunit